MKQCTVLFVNPEGTESAHPPKLREAGFLVVEAQQWPEDVRAIRNYHAVIVRVTAMGRAPMLATHLRAKPHVDRRLLIALVGPDATVRECRSARVSGFDEVLSEACETRQLIARVLRGLRARPELRCSLPRRSAA